MTSPSPRSSPRRLAWFAALLLVGAAAAAAVLSRPRAVRPHGIPLAVVGDSDSHGYHDTRAFADGSADRGGASRATTYQWTEVLATLRGDLIDLGPRAATGLPGRLARGLDAVGIGARAPAKLDHLHNFAVSGQGCDDLWGGASRQVPELLRLMDRDPSAWRRGVVVFRIGVNTFGKSGELDRLARDRNDPSVTARIDDCVDTLHRSVREIGVRHPQTRIVLVGIFDNRHWSQYLARWPTPAEQANIAAGLDRFDDALRRIAAADPRVGFFDDRAWFRSVWGDRATDGTPAYRTVPFGPLQVTNTSGDSPDHATLADGHAGTAWNALWARALVDLLNRRFALGIPPIGDAEAASLLSRPFGR